MKSAMRWRWSGRSSSNVQTRFLVSMAPLSPLDIFWRCWRGGGVSGTTATKPMNLRPPFPHSGKYNTASGSTEPYAGAPRRLPQIGYILKMFPRLSETFIRNEILELERQGLRLRIFSLKRPVETGDRGHDGRIRASITYLPERVFREPFRVFRAHFGTFRRYPGGYVRTLRHVLRGRELGFLAIGLLRFSHSCFT